MYELGMMRGRQVAKKVPREASINEAILEEMDSRQEAFSVDFVRKINAKGDAHKLWAEYERGVKEGLCYHLSSGKS